MSSIMIVEDEALIALSLKNKLEKFGYHIPVVVHTGEEAIEQAAKCNPDLILMDINLGGAMTGTEAAEKIFAEQKTPVIFLTAYSDDKALQMSLDAEPFGYIIKPFKDRELRTAIELALHKNKKTTEALNKSKVKAEESDRLKAAFLATISHEIRTPMNGILGFTELLKQKDLTVEAREKFIKHIEVSGDRLVNLMNDILNISKVDSASMNVVFAETDIDELLRNIFQNLKSEADEKRLLLQVPLRSLMNGKMVRTDSHILEAILTHLVKNAIKFTPQGSVQVGYHLKPDNQNPKELEFYVKDTGIGIAPEKRTIIFERFRQADESLERLYEGAGLGLSIAKAFVELLGGRIWVESDLDKGSVFYYTIPIIDGDVN